MGSTRATGAILASTPRTSPTRPGNLRADYVLPRKSLRLVDAGVFWPLRSDPLSRLTGVFSSADWGLVGGLPASDHRSVWIDVAVPSGT